MKYLLLFLPFLLWSCFTDNENDDSQTLVGNLGNTKFPIVEVDTLNHLIKTERMNYACPDTGLLAFKDTAKTHYQFINDTLILTNMDECSYTKYTGSSKQSIYGTWNAIVDSEYTQAPAIPGCVARIAKNHRSLTIGIVTQFSMTTQISIESVINATNGTICMADAVVIGMTDPLANFDPATEFTKISCNLVAFVTGSGITGTIEYITSQNKATLHYTVDGKTCDSQLRPMSDFFNNNAPTCPIEMTPDQSSEFYSCISKIGV